MVPLVVDVETFSLDEAAQFIEEPTAPSNYKDEAKIKAYVEQKRIENLSRCALDPDLCRIVALGVYGGREAHVEVAEDASDEVSMLKWWWSFTTIYDTFVGFNLLAFDLPVLIRRSQYLGVLVPAVNLDRYRTPHIDLMERLSFNGKIKAHSLDFYCKRFAIDVPDATTGKDVDALVKAGDWRAVHAHCRADIEKTRLLAERLGVLQPQPVEAVL